MPDLMAEHQSQKKITDGQSNTGHKFYFSVHTKMTIQNTDVFI